MVVVSLFLRFFPQSHQQKLRKNGNFASFFAVGAGLNIHSVSRLKALWEDLPQKYQQAFDDMMVPSFPTQQDDTFLPQ